MKQAPIPSFEKERLKALKRLNILDTKPEKRFDNITHQATQELDAPISTISLIDKDREWFKSRIGLKKQEGKRAESFCGHAMLDQKIFIVEDTQNDPRFADNPHVTKDYPPIRFYAGVALHEKETHIPIGTFCIKDIRPRKLSLNEIDRLIKLAKEAEDEINKPRK